MLPAGGERLLCMQTGQTRDTIHEREKRGQKKDECAAERKKIGSDAIES